MLFSRSFAPPRVSVSCWCSCHWWTPALKVEPVNQWRCSFTFYSCHIGCFSTCLPPLFLPLLYLRNLSLPPLHRNTNSQRRGPLGFWISFCIGSEFVSLLLPRRGEGGRIVCDGLSRTLRCSLRHITVGAGRKRGGMETGCEGSHICLFHVEGPAVWLGARDGSIGSACCGL